MKQKGISDLTLALQSPIGSKQLLHDELFWLVGMTMKIAKHYQALSELSLKLLVPERLAKTHQGLFLLQYGFHYTQLCRQFCKVPISDWKVFILYNDNFRTSVTFHLGHRPVWHVNGVATNGWHHLKTFSKVIISLLNFWVAKNCSDPFCSFVVYWLISSLEKWNIFFKMSEENWQHYYKRKIYLLLWPIK